jgi:hypothetical protein
MFLIIENVVHQLLNTDRVPFYVNGNLMGNNPTFDRLDYFILNRTNPIIRINLIFDNSLCDFSRTFTHRKIKNKRA